MPTSLHARSWPRDLELLHSAGWSVVSDAIIREVRHTLAGRLTALMMVEELVRSGVDEEEIIGSLRTEVQRLREMTHLMDLLPASGMPGDQALDVGELLGRAMALQSGRVDGPGEDRKLRIDVETPAALWNPTLLTRVILLVLDALQGADGRVEVEVSPGEMDRVLLRLTGRAGEGPSDPTRTRVAQPLKERLRLISRILVRDGGAVRMRQKERTAQVELEIPGLQTRDRLAAARSIGAGGPATP